MHRKTVISIIGGLTLACALAGCSASAPAPAPPETSAPPSETTPETSPAPADTDPEVYRDTISSMRQDPGADLLAELLREADEGGHDIALDLLIRRTGTTGGDVNLTGADTAELTLQPAEAEFFTVAASADVLDHADAGAWLPVQGVFAVDAAGLDTEHPVYALTLTGAIEPDDAEDEARCRAIDAVEAQVMQAAEDYDATQVDGYAALRDEWKDAPKLWGAIKDTSESMQGEHPEAGDHLSQVCGEYW